MNINDYGWNEYFEIQWKERKTDRMIAGRITADYGQLLRVVTADGELCLNRPIQKLNSELQIAVGDWVALEYTSETEMAIRAVLNRKTKFSRAAAGIEIKEQIVAANVDTVFITQVVLSEKR